MKNFENKVCNSQIKTNFRNVNMNLFG